VGSEDRDTLVERWIKRCKNQPVLAAVILFATVVGGAATLGDSAMKLYKRIVPDVLLGTIEPSARLRVSPSVEVTGNNEGRSRGLRRHGLPYIYKFSRAWRSRPSCETAISSDSRSRRFCVRSAIGCTCL
jgi:hypothetical protein